MTENPRANGVLLPSQRSCKGSHSANRAPQRRSDPREVNTGQGLIGGLIPTYMLPFVPPVIIILETKKLALSERGI
jgi:hypothetical protein